MRERGGAGNGIPGFGLGIIREVVECELSSVVLGFFGGPEDIGSVEVEAVDCDGGGEARVMVEANLGGVVLRQPPFPLLAELLQPGFVHPALSF